MPWSMRPNIGKHCLPIESHPTSNACRPWPMSFAFGQCSYAMNDVGQSMHTHNFWWCMPWMMSPNIGRCKYATTDVTLSMRTCHNKLLQALDDIIWHWSMRAGHESCRPADTHMPRVKLVSLGRYWCHWKTSFSIWSYATSNAFRS